MTAPESPITDPMFAPGELVWFWVFEDGRPCLLVGEVRTTPVPDIDRPDTWLYSVDVLRGCRRAVAEPELIRAVVH